MRHDIGMTTPAVWISTTTSEVTFDNDTPGNYWELVGTINTAEEADLSKHIKVLPNLRSTAPRISGFYLSGDPDSAWVQAAKKRPRRPTIVLDRHRPLGQNAAIHPRCPRNLLRQHRKGHGHEVTDPPATRTPSRRNHQTRDDRHPGQTQRQRAVHPARKPVAGGSCSPADHAETTTQDRPLPVVPALIRPRRDAHSRWPVEACAVRVERRPVHRLVAGEAGPGGVSSAVTKAGLVAHEHCAGAEDVPVGAARGRVGDPLPSSGLYKLAQHLLRPMTCSGAFALSHAPSGVP